MDGLQRRKVTRKNIRKPIFPDRGQEINYKDQERIF
jgi:hypothetical protein